MHCISAQIYCLVLTNYLLKKEYVYEFNFWPSREMYQKNVEIGRHSLYVDLPHTGIYSLRKSLTKDKGHMLPYSKHMTILTWIMSMC